MLVDFNIDENYEENQIENLNNIEYDAIIITKNIEASDLTKMQEIKILKDLNKKCYNRINVKFKKETISSNTMKRLSSFDIISFELNDYNQLKFAIDLQPDLITFDYSNDDLKLKPGFIRDAINRNIFFEITLRDSLYSEKKEWLRNINDLLRITKGRRTVVGSGAIYSNEIKKTNDIELMLQFFLCKKRAKLMIKENPYELLKQCALKRNSYRNLIANNTKGGNLKEDFINKDFS